MSVKVMTLTEIDEISGALSAQPGCGYPSSPWVIAPGAIAHDDSIINTTNWFPQCMLM